MTAINNCITNIERMKSSVKDGSVWTIHVLRYHNGHMPNFYHVSYETTKADPEALAESIVNYWESIKENDCNSSIVQFVESKDLWYQHFFCYTYPVVFGDGTVHEPMTHCEHQFLVHKSGNKGFVNMADMIEEYRPVLDKYKDYFKNAKSFL